MTSLHLEHRCEPPRIPVSVNGVELPYDEITREVQHHPAPSPEQAWNAAARALIVRSVLLEEARNKGIEPHPAVGDDGLRETDEEALIRQLIAQQVRTPQSDDESCRRFYEQNTDRFRSSAIYEASHILLAASQNDEEAYSACRAQAQGLCEHLREKPGDFEQLAKEVSDCTSATLGGNLGQLSSGQTTLEFEAAMEKMTPGEISIVPVESRYGLHIIKLLRRIDGKLLPFEAVKDRISAYLSDRVERTAIAQYIARLVFAADVCGIEMPSVQDMRVF